MTVEEDFVTAITGDSAINALIGTRLYPVKLPDNVTYPAAVYSLVSTVIQGSGGCKRSRLQLDLYDESYSGLKALRDAVVAYGDGGNGYIYEENADVWEEDNDLYHQPIDFLLDH